MKLHFFENIFKKEERITINIIYLFSVIGLSDPSNVNPASIGNIRKIKYTPHIGLYIIGKNNDTSIISKFNFYCFVLITQNMRLIDLNVSLTLNLISDDDMFGETFAMDPVNGSPKP